MKTYVLGNTGIEVTELCFGALPMGPRQKNMKVEDSTKVVVTALEKGINFVDTAQMYETYEPIRKAMKLTGIKPVIASKSTASSFEDMDKAVNEALTQLDVDYIDIFHLHAARVGLNVFEERAGALECLKKYKKSGQIKAIGISTHNAKVAKMVADRDDIDILFCLYNKTGIGLLEGNVQDMREAIKLNSEAGKGVYLMKVLGGGILIDRYAECMEFARKTKGYHSIAVGMVSPEEVNFNVSYFNGDFDEKKMPSIKGNSKKFKVFESLCKGCRSCTKVCPNFAIEYNEQKKCAIINENKCLTCGYCTSACPEFAIRLI